ncbi:type II toxin-antitoxin system MqsR family toxin [Ideonella azotifigens]|uniref:type II toxin-antitoxin system MqsR family toxin n=1 Tax=Ideonella azotifigens TaxID=513160 RepID=UPI00114301AC|nr:type II toxin-antitoxin system MqsR family toxin [Ideonella azotifigens]MCD2340494.1 type II toxin-antitoxin system MqsR family toxin [Ideonella azotifigens]
MEKGRPHCKLKLVHALVRADKVRATRSAMDGAGELGISTLAAMCEVVLSL